MVVCEIPIKYLKKMTILHDNVYSGLKPDHVTNPHSQKPLTGLKFIYLSSVCIFLLHPLPLVPFFHNPLEKYSQRQLRDGEKKTYMPLLS